MNSFQSRKRFIEEYFPLKSTLKEMNQLTSKLVESKFVEGRNSESEDIMPGVYGKCPIREN